MYVIIMVNGLGFYGEIPDAEQLLYWKYSQYFDKFEQPLKGKLKLDLLMEYQRLYWSKDKDKDNDRLTHDQPSS